MELLEFVLMRNGEHSDAEVFESLVQVQLDELISDSRRGEKEVEEGTSISGATPLVQSSRTAYLGRW